MLCKYKNQSSDSPAPTGKPGRPGSDTQYGGSWTPSVASLSRTIWEPLRDPISRDEDRDMIEEETHYQSLPSTCMYTHT